MPVTHASIESSRHAVRSAADAIAARHKGKFPTTALILGSGLGGFCDHMSVETAIGYEEIPEFPASTVAGHAGRLVIGKAGATPLACMQGRMHLYEGYSPQRLAVPIRTLRRLGVATIIVTNAAGSLRTTMPPGTLMIVDDHINLAGRNPLTGPNDDDLGPRFFDMTTAYDRDLRGRLRHAAARAEIPVTSGIYVQVAGPNFETPAEVRMLAKLGADAVGMSTVPECLVARHCGMRVAALSVITNLAAGLGTDELTHTGTMDEAAKAGERMTRLLLEFLDAGDTPAASKRQRSRAPGR